MAHESFERRDVAHGSSNRAFGIVCSVALTLFAILPLVRGGHIRVPLLAGAGAFLLAALAFPSLLTPLNRAWTRLGLLLHRVTTPVVLGVMFFLVITPIGLLMRALGKNPLKLERDFDAGSYWVRRTPPGPAPESLKDQF